MVSDRQVMENPDFRLDTDNDDCMINNTLTNYEEFSDASFQDHLQSADSLYKSSLKDGIILHPVKLFQIGKVVRKKFK